jgi:hypothetical protein
LLVKNSFLMIVCYILVIVLFFINYTIMFTLHSYLRKMIGLLAISALMLVQLFSFGVVSADTTNLGSPGEQKFTCTTLTTSGTVKDDFFFKAEDDIYAFGTSDRIFHWDGDRWSLVTKGAVSQHMSVADDGTIYAIGSRTRAIHKWVVGATRWERITGRGTVMDDFHLVGENKIYSFGTSGRVFVWHNERWNLVSRRAVSQALQRMPSGDLYAIGTKTGKIHKWKEFQSDNWRAISAAGNLKDDFHMFAEDNIYAFDKENRVVHWDGTSWNPVTQGVALHESLHMVNENLFYAIDVNRKINKCQRPFVVPNARLSVDLGAMVSSDSYVAGTTDIKAFSFVISANETEDIRVNSIAVRFFIDDDGLFDNGGQGDSVPDFIQQAKLYEVGYDGALLRQVGSTMAVGASAASNYRTNFGGLSEVISAGGLKAYAVVIDTFPSIEGERHVAVDIDPDDDVAAIGFSSASQPEFLQNARINAISQTPNVVQVITQ